MLLYKYRSIENWEFLFDILINQRLFASKYFELNDPMEGQYLYREGMLDQTLVSALKDIKRDIRICSLSQNPEHELMWAHYANGHNGIVIGAKFDKRTQNIRAMEYDGILEITDQRDFVSTEDAYQILSHKSANWEYEDEYRVFLTDGEFVPCEIRNIYIGQRVSETNERVIRALAEKFLPGIEIIESTSRQIF